MSTGDYINAIIAAAAVAAFLLSLYALWMSKRQQQESEERARKAEDITRLLGENETVAFAALKLQKEGLQPEAKDRELLLRAMVTACVFTSSDRARALLYDVIERYRCQYHTEIRDALANVRRTFEEAESYNFPEPQDPCKKDKLDLCKGFYRLQLAEAVFAGNKMPRSNCRGEPQQADTEKNR